jgi:putative membrane protein
MSRPAGHISLWALLSALGTILCISTIAGAAVTQEDRQFLTRAAQANLDTIMLSRLAKTRASRPDVKAFAEKMVTDHTILQKKLQPFALAWSVTLPKTADAEHRAEYRKLRHLSGAAFDKEYVNVMDKDHNDVLVAFTHEANIASDPDFKSTIISEKSVTAAHTNMADDLKSKL